MLDFLTRRANWIIAAFAVLVFLLGQSKWLQNSELWQTAEGSFIDRRYLLRGKRIPHPDVIILGVQSSSLALDTLSPEEIKAAEALQLMQKPWPWDRKIYALILERLIQSHAKVIMFDFVFRGETSGDRDFAQALTKYQDKVVIGSMFSEVIGSGNVPYQQYVTPNESVLLTSNTPIVGFVNTWPDPDDIVRRGRYQVSQWLLSGIQMTNDTEELLALSAMAVKKFQGAVDLPPYDNSNFINFAGPNGTYEILPVENMFVEQLWEAPPFNSGSVFKDKIVVVGPMAEIFHDVHNTPLKTMAGPEIQANMVATLLSQSSLRDSSKNLNLGLLAGMILGAAVICMFIESAGIKVLLLGVVSVGFLVISQLLFTGSQLVVAMLPPIFGLCATGIVGIGFRYVLEQFEKNRVRSVLERYVSKNVASTILNDPRSFVESLRGRKQPVTILFSDIRGFTSMTEEVDADDLVAQLNEYFLEMVGIILREDGTVQKYIGDAIMAAWGDTHSKGLHQDAEGAVRAALAMRPRLAKLNAGWVGKEGRKQLKSGIGVNLGEVIVGNIGHPERMEFTVLGDGVNVAARLESATKQFHTDILVGEEVEKLTREKFVYRNVGAIAFKGKTKPIEVYFLLSDRSEAPPPWLAVYHEALRLYRQRDFEAASEKFLSVQNELGEDYLCEMYLERCTMLLKMPPSDTWDGSFALSEK
jgi:adenylate cyclase